MFRFIFITLPLLFFNLVRLFLFVLCLFPGFIRFGWYYFIASDRVSLPYDSKSVRQRVDVYRACTHNNGRQQQEQLDGSDSNFNMLVEELLNNSPVVIFCTGGAWMIGYKMWGALLARALTAAGMVVVIPDMRNYPLVDIPEMVDDIDLAIGWTKTNIAQYGGDPENIVVVGQSAGGHVACMAIFRNIQRKIAREIDVVATEGLGVFVPDDDDDDDERNTNISSASRVLEDDALNDAWSASDLKGFAAISSPMTLGSVITHSFRRHGLDDAMVERMFGFKKDEYDPCLTLQNFQSVHVDDKEKFLKDLPPISIYHGTKDKTVPYEASDAFYEELRRASMLDENSISFVSYVGWSHTDPILEAPMDGDHRLHRDLLNDVNKWTTSPCLIWPNDSKVNDRLCPHFMVKLSRFVNPF